MNRTCSVSVGVSRVQNELNQFKGELGNYMSPEDFEPFDYRADKGIKDFIDSLVVRRR
jgi:hypothetical protein